MAELIAIGYPDETTALQALDEAPNLARDLIIETDAAAEIVRHSTIDKEFQQQVRDMVQPGTSALFLVLEKAAPDKAVAAMSKFGGTVLKTSTSEEDTARLQEALHGAPVYA